MFRRNVGVTLQLCSVKSLYTVATLWTSALNLLY